MLSRYDKHFGGARGAAQKALDSMRRTYGREQGEHVFYARVAKLERRGKMRRKAKFR